MKKILLPIVGFFLLFASCEMRDEITGGKTGEEETLGAMTLQLSLNTTKSTQESVNIEDFIIQILDKQNEIVKESTYAALAKDEYMVNLPAGDYKVVSASYAGEVEEAAFDKPYYYGQKEFSIKEKELATIKDTCKLGNVLVDVSYNDDFLNAVNDDFTVTLTNGAGILNLYKDNQSKSYFKVSKSISIAVRGKTKNGQDFYKSQTLTGPNNTLEAGHSFSIVLGVNDTIPSTPDPGPENPEGGDNPSVGEGSFNVVIDVTMRDREEEIVIPCPGEEDNGGGDDNNNGGGTTSPGGSDDKGKPSISGTGTYVFDLSLNPQDPSKSKVDVTINAPNGLQNIYIKITSDNQGFLEDLAALTSFDLVNPGDLTSGLIELGLLQSAAGIKGDTKYNLNLTGDETNFVYLLTFFGAGVHTFNLEVVDSNNNSVKDQLVIRIVDSL
ncbi:MAG: DUF4493 domain-containing protein [Tannerellaceae bacterium]|nr:DUF4493 domain-containing protein [Tannerellaceae bacterium]